MDHRIQVVIADDHEIYRDGLRVLFKKSNRIVLTGEASTGKQLIALCEEALPDVILTDVMMPVMDGVGAAKYIAEHFPSVRIIALSMFNDDNLILDMLNAGASGYLIKNANNSEIIDAVESVYKNKPYYCTATSHKLARLIGRRHHRNEGRQRISFSEKEVDIIKLICKEKTTREIGDALNMSTRTIEEYRHRLKEKMKVKGTAGVVVYAIKNEIFKLDKNG